MFRRLRSDIQCILDRDPAARSTWEVITCYPGLHAVVMHRFAHWMWTHGLKWLGRFVSMVARWLTGIEIHPGARIGRGFFIDHGMGVVIGETTIIGDWVTLNQGVTLGGTGKQRGKRHPTIEDHVVVGVSAVVLGAITIGEGAKIGGGAVVVKDVPPHSTAVGVPARVVVTRDPRTGATRRVEDMPDPEGQMLRGLRAKVLELEQRLTEVELSTDHHHMEHHLAFDALPDKLWATLGENGKKDDEFMLGAGI